MFRLNYSVSPFSLQIDMDGRGLTAMQYKYDMLQTSTLQTSIDSGTQRTLVDAAGQPLYAWDAEDRKTEIIYDELRRPLKRIINDKELERYIYGEGLVNDKINNLRGQLYQHYDGSGLQQINIYDFKGNPLETQQQLLEDATISDADWSINPALNAEIFTSAITYDALNRPITQTDPGGNVHEFTYDKGGFLKKVKLNTDEYVKDIHYDAKGQRQAIWYGNGTKTSYTYDTFTFRLRRLLTVNLNTNDILQDLNYWYDPVGNITEIQDAAQQTLFFNNSVVNPTQKFVYDAIYRLIEAKGRELIGTADFGGTDNWNDAAWKTNHKGDGNAVQNYTQKYTYDEVGNILSLQHVASTGSYTRTYVIDSSSNKLLSTIIGANTYNYSHDIRGNMITMPHLNNMDWNLENELKSIVKGVNTTHYQYSNGERIRKFTDKGSIKEERIYFGNFEVYRKFDTGSLTQSTGSVPKVERTTVHIKDDTGRIAMLEKRTFGSAADDNGTAEELTRYIYSNHLQSASLELDETGDIISYEEYHPYGTTSYQAMNALIKATAKRYRYTGKERDEESGLYYHGARYYIPWLCRWVSVDPLESKYTPQSPYVYCSNNPANRIDEDGMSDGIPRQYEIKKDDTFEGISIESKGRFSVEDLKKWNPSINDRKLQIGQNINISDPSKPMLLGSFGRVGSTDDVNTGDRATGTARTPQTEVGKKVFADVEKVPDEILIDLYWQANRHGLSLSADRDFNQEAVHKILNRFIEGKGGVFTDLPNISKKLWGTKEGRNLQNRIADEFRYQMNDNFGDYQKITLSGLSPTNFGNESKELLALVGGTQQLDIKLTNMEFTEDGYTATIQAILWDIYGVNEEDATRNRGFLTKVLGGEIGLRAMWVLQNQRGKKPMTLGYIHTFKVSGKINPTGVIK